MNTGLTFEALRSANIKRIPLFKNRKGGAAHSHPEGRDWSPAQWLQATVGELGEYANLRKKFDRGDISEEEFMTEAAHELADVMIYLDILAFQLGIDLGAATIDKFNIVSDRVGCGVKLKTDGSGHWLEGPHTPQPPAPDRRSQYLFMICHSVDFSACTHGPTSDIYDLLETSPEEGMVIRDQYEHVMYHASDGGWVVPESE